jgi:hypothetical protein
MTKVLHDIFLVLKSVVSEPYHFRGAGAITRFKLASCDTGVKLLELYTYSVKYCMSTLIGSLFLQVIRFVDFYF